MVNLLEKVSLHVILGAFVQKLIFQDGRQKLSFISRFSKKPRIFVRDMEAKFIRSIEVKSIIKTCQPENCDGNFRLY